MFDRSFQAKLEPVWRATCRPLRALGVTPLQLTLSGWILGLISAWLIANHQESWALGTLLLSRVCDALDGALARQTRPTDSGGYLDLVLDFWFYAAIPLAFAWQSPDPNALAAAALLAAYLLNATAWLTFTSLPASMHDAATSRQAKSLAFLPSLTEGGETIAVYVAMCLWPVSFAPIAWGFAALCTGSALWHTARSWRRLQSTQSQPLPPAPSTESRRSDRGL